LPISEIFTWEDLPKGYIKMETGSPHYRITVDVGTWARANGFHKEKF